MRSRSRYRPIVLPGPSPVPARSRERDCSISAIADNTFLFATVLRNDSTLVQAWPHIELALADTADKTLVRRIIKPAEYLPRADTSRGFAAKTEQPVKVYFQLSGVTASGYHIAIFYP